MGSRTPAPDEVRQEAVRLVTEQGLPASRVAHDLGSDPEPVRRWLRAQQPTIVSTDALPPAAELPRLRRENEQLRMERDILRQARGICSRLPQ